VTDEERDRRLSAVEMDIVHLRIAYRALGDAWGLFGDRLRGTRPDECEAFYDRWRELRRRADSEAERLAEEIFEANVGITNDGPDRWTRDLDRMNHDGNKEK
jgi:hypothetical protein